MWISSTSFRRCEMSAEVPPAVREHPLRSRPSVFAEALVRHHVTGSETILRATGEDYQHARFRALALIREGETLVSVEYQEWPWP